MKLTKEQIQEIESYIVACGIQWYDVKTELVDHFATSLEEKFDKKPILNFKQAIIDEHKSFGDIGFKKLLETKTKAVEKQFYKQVLTHLKSFFKIPKILISAGFFYGLVLIMNLFSNKEHFFIGLTTVAFTIAAVVLIRISNGQNNKRTQFLILDKTTIFLQQFNVLMILFSNITVLRSEDSFNFQSYNFMQIGVFVLLMLFYWCSEYVFFMNKKYVKTNYPEIAI